MSRRILAAPFLSMAVQGLYGCNSKPTVIPASDYSPRVQFIDVTNSAGLRFRQINGAHGRKYLPETMGSGCAFLDYDNDGLQDILIVNGTEWSGTTSNLQPSLSVYHNDGLGHFTDVTREVGLGEFHTYGMGVAVGDYDNDGFDDILITGVGGCHLLHNEPSPTHHSQRRVFRDVTNAAGVQSPGWSTSATWLDYDRDGKLDLFVCHYVKWSRNSNRPYSIDGVHLSYSTPEQYPGESCRLYHNEGGGRFKDVSRSAGILNVHSKSLGVVAFDFDHDGLIDILVTNDTQPNFLFHNQGDGTFKEVALESGIAVSEQGKAKAGMGVDVADDRILGKESIVITNFSGEQLSLYRPDPSGHYLDEAARSGIGTISQLYLGFGVLFLDYDMDGQIDLFVANGHIQGDVALRQNGVVYREPALLLRNVGGGKYVEATYLTGDALKTPLVGRGAAWGDFDNDGDPDLLLTSNAGEPETNTPLDGQARLLKNERPHGGNHWIRLRLEGVRSNRDAYGARARILAAGRVQSQVVKASSSYLSQSDRRLLFGLGRAAKVDSIEIEWPSGRVQTLGSAPADRSYYIREEGSVVQEEIRR